MSQSVWKEGKRDSGCGVYNYLFELYVFARRECNNGGH